jgi:pyruvate/2-oxoglutarate dehydrogenase complex dihydrolipoamide dehydrogenase (E3) component
MSRYPTKFAFNRVMPKEDEDTAAIVAEALGRDGVAFKAGVDFDPRLGIAVNDNLRTTNPDVYAVGDVAGATIVGSHAGDQISEVSVAIRAGMGLAKLGSVIHPYPTAAEAIRQCGDAYMRSQMTPTLKRLFNRFLAMRR